jgi:hypothetical protein
MGTDDEATAGCLSAVGVIGWRVGAYKGRPGGSWWPPRRLFVSSAAFAVAVLAGCSPGRSTASAAGEASASQTPLTTSPSPVTTSPSPSPAITGAAALCVTSAAKGSCGPYDYRLNTASNGYNTYVGQDVWNPIPGWHQTLTAINPGSWHVTANMPAGNTAVVSYPSSSQASSGDGTTSTVSSYTTLSSSFAEDMHATAGTDAEAAYDIWLNNWADEVMIQHDFSPLRPRCGTTLATVAFAEPGTGTRQNWNYCQYGSERIWQLAGGSEQSGSVNILAMLSWLMAMGRLPQNSTLTSIGYGFEICSTGSRQEMFTISRYSISMAKSRP